MTLEAPRALALGRHPLHLGRGGSAVAQPEFTGVEWYAAYAERHDADGANGRLVSLYSFAESWTSWEMHPAGAEVVVCTSGEITLIQDLQSGPRHVTLRVGEYAINPPGVWHTADVAAHATALFVTPGIGTDHRPR